MEEMLSWIAFPIQSITVKIDIIENIPIVIPNSDRKVLNLLTNIELTANMTPSLKSFKNILNLLWAIFIKTKDTKSDKNGLSQNYKNNLARILFSQFIEYYAAESPPLDATWAGSPELLHFCYPPVWSQNWINSSFDNQLFLIIEGIKKISIFKHLY